LPGVLESKPVVELLIQLRQVVVQSIQRLFPEFTF
jgi:hypothetical protein